VYYAWFEVWTFRETAKCLNRCSIWLKCYIFCSLSGSGAPPPPPGTSKPPAPAAPAAPPALTTKPGPPSKCIMLGLKFERFRFANRPLSNFNLTDVNVLLSIFFQNLALPRQWHRLVKANRVHHYHRIVSLLLHRGDRPKLHYHRFQCVSETIKHCWAVQFFWRLHFYFLFFRIECTTSSIRRQTTCSYIVNAGTT
jgi:hypothetical protein